MERNGDSRDVTRLFEVVLAEQFGADRAAAVAAQVAAAGPERRAAALRAADAADRAAAGAARWSRLFAAAALLLGLLAVAGTIWLRNGEEDARFLLPPQDPADPRLFVPKDNAQFLELMAAATVLRIERHEVLGATSVVDASGASDRLDLEPWPETLRVDGAPLAAWKDAIRSSAAATAAWTGVDVVLYVYLDLPGDRTLRCFANLGDDATRLAPGVEKEEAIVPDDRLRALLREARDELDRRHRQARGIAEHVGELATLPAGSAHVTCPVPLEDRLVPLLARFTALQSLRLVPGPEARFPDDALLRDLRQLAQLQELDVAAQMLTDASLAVVAAMPRLERLVLRGEGNQLAVTGAGFAAFRGRPLREVTLHGCQGFDRTGMQALAGLPGLRVLRFVGTPLGEDFAWLAELPAFPSLRELAVRSKDLADRHLAPLLQTKLGRLVLVDAAVTGEGLAALAGLPSLQELELVTKELGDDDVEDLGKLQSLRRLVLRNVKITAAGLDELKAALPNCEIDCRPGSRLFDTARVFDR